MPFWLINHQSVKIIVSLHPVAASAKRIFKAHRNDTVAIRAAFWALGRQLYATAFGMPDFIEVGCNRLDLDVARYKKTA
jgi:hypothetical protein